MASLRRITSNDKNFNINKYKLLDPIHFKKLVSLSRKLKHKTVIHINATEKGGGVAELLQSQIGFERSLGIDSRWYIIDAPSNFFVVTKKIHNLLQGKQAKLSDKEKKIYTNITDQLSKSLTKILDTCHRGVIIVHDPQPLPIIKVIPKNFYSILRLHIDLSTPDSKTLNFIKPLIKTYSRLIVTNSQFAKDFSWYPKSKISIIPPAINPFTEKNSPMDIKRAKQILKSKKLLLRGPLITQVSRFDPWKDPVGVIKAFHIVKQKYPNVHLALAGFFQSQDDPEAKKIYKIVTSAASKHRDIHCYSNLRMLGNLKLDTFINALYTASTIVLQKSLREGFGLTITEAMWKGKPVIAGITPGTRMQITNRKNGILVSSPTTAAQAIIELLESEKLRDKLGRAAKTSVKKNFLMPRYILDHLKLYAKHANI